MKSKATLLLVLVVAIGIPSVALANVGTPLMWATSLHMVFGNALIGVLEGVLLAWIYRVSTVRAIVLMILANYFSAWIGWTWLSGLWQDRSDLTLYNASRIVWGMVAAAYAATLVLEWPFVIGCLWGSRKYLHQSFGASLRVQSISYVILFGWYGLASVTSLFTETAIVPPGQISLPSNVLIYYIATEDGNVYSRRLGTEEIERVFELNSNDFADCLSFETSRLVKGSQELVALLESDNYNDPKLVSLGVVVADADCPQTESHQRLIRSRYSGPSEGLASKLGTASQSPWAINAGFWPAQGLSGENSKTGEHIRFALETPFVQWAVRHAILLPSDQVLFQIGNRQICILDLETRKVAMLCSGRGAVAVLHQQPTRPQTIE